MDGGGEGLESWFVGGGGLGIVVVVVLKVLIVFFGEVGIIDTSSLGRPWGFLIEGLKFG